MKIVSKVKIKWYFYNHIWVKIIFFSNQTTSTFFFESHNEKKKKWKIQNILNLWAQEFAMECTTIDYEICCKLFNYWWLEIDNNAYSQRTISTLF